MFDMLNVAIGIVFIFLLLSLICSAINELVEAKLKLRAVDLEQGIRELLNDPGGNTYTKKIYDHPLVSSLYRGKYNSDNIRTDTGPENHRYERNSTLPSYIPSRNFALALMDILVSEAPPAAAPAADQPGGSSAAPAPPVVEGAARSQRYFQPLRISVAGLKNDQLKTGMLTILDAAGNDADKTRAGIENWYNSTMDRVSGWYKRRVQKIIFWMGFAVAIALNADTLAIFSNLTNDRPLRDAIVAAAKERGPATGDKPLTNGELRANVDTLLQMGLPIGWAWRSDLYDDPAVPANYRAIPPFRADAWAASLTHWFLKALGWFITAMAISLGAPFWFDMLNKIMVVRSTVKPHEKSPEEASMDKT